MSARSDRRKRNREFSYHTNIRCRRPARPGDAVFQRRQRSIERPLEYWMPRSRLRQGSGEAPNSHARRSFSEGGKPEHDSGGCDQSRSRTCHHRNRPDAAAERAGRAAVALHGRARAAEPAAIAACCCWIRTRHGSRSTGSAYSAASTPRSGSRPESAHHIAATHPVCRPSAVPRSRDIPRRTRLVRPRPSIAGRG